MPTTWKQTDKCLPVTSWKKFQISSLETLTEYLWNLSRILKYLYFTLKIEAALIFLNGILKMSFLTSCPTPGKPGSLPMNVQQGDHDL